MIAFVISAPLPGALQFQPCGPRAQGKGSAGPILSRGLVIGGDGERSFMLAIA
jgi:hypothetical protein